MSDHSPHCNDLEALPPAAPPSPTPKEHTPMHTDPLPPTEGPRISRVTMARLFNLGNFDHARYELTVELPPGTPPSSVLRELESAMTDLDPKPPVTSQSLADAQELLRAPYPTLESIEAQQEDDPFDDFDAAKELQRALARRDRAAALVNKHNEWELRHQFAMQRLDALGGLSGARYSATEGKGYEGGEG